MLLLGAMVDEETRVKMTIAIGRPCVVRHESFCDGRWVVDLRSFVACVGVGCTVQVGLLFFQMVGDCQLHNPTRILVDIKFI